MEKYQVIWLGSLGILVFVGILIVLVNVSTTKYYQQQYYNNLPSMQSYETPKPEPIQHYEEVRDESVEATETINVVERLPNHSSIIGSFNDNKLIIYNEDDSLDIMALVVFSMVSITSYYVIRNTLYCSLPRPREIWHLILSLIMAIVILKLFT